MKIKWLKIAMNDLDEIFDYIARDNREAAEKVVEIIWQRTKVLAELPEIGREGRVAGTRELFIEKTKFVIPYRVKKGVVEILRVFHSSRNWPGNF